jgi:hypothetical protein
MKLPMSRDIQLAATSPGGAIQVIAGHPQVDDLLHQLLLRNRRDFGGSTRFGYD